MHLQILGLHFNGYLIRCWSGGSSQWTAAKHNIHILHLTAGPLDLENIPSFDIFGNVNQRTNSA